MYQPGRLQVVSEKDTIYDSQQDDYPQQAVGTVYLLHACDEWVIGGRGEVEALMHDLMQYLDKTDPDNQRNG